LSLEIKINAERLWQSLEEMAAVGATEAGGNCRLALTSEDKAGRDLFCQWAREAGCDVTVDEVGNLFVHRAGTNASQAPVMTGSHLDTQPTGGRYDGVYGVLAGLEVLRALNDHGVTTNRPVEVVVWSNEEGSRFQPGMTGSGVFCGEFSRDTVYATCDEQGISYLEALDAIGARGAPPAKPRDIHTYIEAHIEQGPVLEAEDKTIGVVTGIQGIKWFKARVVGVNAHAGTTPMEVRRDPLVAAGRMVDQISQITKKLRPDAVATVGMFTALPGSVNVINQEVRFSIDLRCPDESALNDLGNQLQAECLQIAYDTGVQLELEEIWNVPPTVFPESAVSVVETATNELGLSNRRIVSGAGHDAKYLANISPTAMIFVPCKDGISHNEAESILPEHAAAGAEVLLQSILKLANQ